MGKQAPRRRFKTEKARQLALARRIIFLVLGLCVVIAAFVGVQKLKDALFAEPEDDGLILPNVYVAGVNIGGLAPTDARSALQLALSDSYATDDLVVTLPGDSLTLSPANTGAQLDVNAAVEEAYNYGRTGTPAENAKTREEAETKVYTVALLPYLDLDLNYIYSTVETFCDGYSIEMTQPTVELQGTRPEYPHEPEDWNEEENGPYVPDFSSIAHQTLVITMGTPDFILEPQALYNCILDAYSLHKMEVSYEAPTLTEPDKIDLVAVFEEFCTLPVDAEMDDKTFAVTDEIYGYGFDIDAVTALLENAQYGQQLSIKLDFLTPDITAEALAGDLFKVVLAEYTSSCSDAFNADRDTNLRLACEALNGYVIKAGETFSFNTAVGPCTTNRGYKTAPSFSGSTASVLGGGISQIASALYCCALRADLVVTERACHAFAVDYTDLGQDAYVSYGNENLCFVNTTTQPIRIVAQAEGSTVTIQLLGTPNEGMNYYVGLESVIFATYAPNTIYQPMSEDNQQGYVDGYVLQSGITGYDIGTYLCKYNLETGELISRVIIASDHYEKRDVIIVRIEGTENSPVDPTLPSYPVDINYSGNP